MSYFKKTSFRNIISVLILIIVHSSCTIDRSKNSQIDHIILLPSDTTMYVGDTLLIQTIITPEDKSKVHLLWYSSDTNSVKVDDGLIIVYKAGEALITAESPTDSVKAYVNIISIEKEKTIKEETYINSNYKFIYNTDKASVKNGLPSGEGKMIFISYSRIDIYDDGNRYIQPGEFIKGEWINGHLQWGVWYDINGNIKEVIQLDPIN